MKKIILCFLLFSALLGASEPKASLYDLNSSWLDVEGKDTKVSIAKGSYTLIAMIYTGCAHACPMIISKIQKIEKTFLDQGIKDLKIVLASFDVQNDRPEKLKKYQQSRKLDFSKWKFLAAKSEADARELAVTLGISYKDLGDGDFSHSNVISLLDPSGAVISSIDNLNASADGMLASLKESLKKSGGK